MSEIVLDRIRLCADGSIDLTVRLTPSADEPPPSAASVHLVARGGGADLRIPAELTDEGEGRWSATAVVPPQALADLPADAAVLDCTVDVVLEGDVLSGRIFWGGAGTRWLPYPTASRKLSLTRVAS